MWVRKGSELTFRPQNINQSNSKYNKCTPPTQLLFRQTKLLTFADLIYLKGNYSSNDDKSALRIECFERKVGAVSHCSINDLVFEISFLVHELNSMNEGTIGDFQIFRFSEKVCNQICNHLPFKIVHFLPSRRN